MLTLSPILSNFLLRHFDKAFTDNRYDLVRYADDLIVLASSRDECTAIKALTIGELSKLGLEVSGKPPVGAVLRGDVMSVLLRS